MVCSSKIGNKQRQSAKQIYPAPFFGFFFPLLDIIIIIIINQNATDNS